MAIGALCAWFVTTYIEPTEAPSWDRFQRFSFVLSSVCAPLAEETTFRGTLWTLLSKAIDRRLAVVVVTALFTLSHLAFARPPVTVLIIIAAMGLIALWFRVESGSLLPAFVFHSTYNLCNMAVAIST